LNTWLKNNLLLVTGIIAGGIAGFLYWNYVGCSSGTCLITSKYVNSTVYGAVMGGLVFSIFEPQKKFRQ
jgi:hypothetical protein